MSGSLFLSDTNSRQIYRVRSLNGARPLLDNAQAVVGTGEQCVPFDEARCGDGGKAVEATLMSPRGDVLLRNIPVFFSISDLGGAEMTHSTAPYFILHPELS